MIDQSIDIDVKDLRTGVESRDPEDVLDGNLDPFMGAALAQAIGGKAEEAVADLDKKALSSASSPEHRNRRPPARRRAW